jgi:hypothetical protein
LDAAPAWQAVAPCLRWFQIGSGLECNGSVLVECTLEIKTNSGTAFYLAGHGSFTRPRLIELQYWRICRYREAFGSRYEERHRDPAIFIDFRLPRFGMGNVDLSQVPNFEKLLNGVREKLYNLVFVDLDDTRQRLTPDYESGFVRDLLEQAGARVLNAFTDDKGAFERAVKERCGQSARPHEVTDESDFVCFFPSLTSGIAEAALSRELQEPEDQDSKNLRRISNRIEDLKRLRPYSGGGRPFVEGRLSFEWQKPRRVAW